jgi:hypothetical protein
MFYTYRQTETVIYLHGHNRFISEMWQQEARGKKIDDAVVDKWFISCDQNDIWSVTNGLQKCWKGPPLQLMHN